jgi:hypothetical protein
LTEDVTVIAVPLDGAGRKLPVIISAERVRRSFAGRVDEGRLAAREPYVDVYPVDRILYR